MQKLINRLFRMEEINGHEMCPTYMYRWTLLKIGSYGLYLHHFVADDWSRDMHDHPKHHYDLVRCGCGRVYWALQRKRGGPLHLELWPGSYRTPPPAINGAVAREWHRLHGV